MTIGRFPRSRLSSPKPSVAEFGQIAKVQYKDPTDATLDQTVLKYRDEFLQLSCDLVPFFEKRERDTATNIKNLAEQLNVKTLAVVYGSAHVTPIANMLSDFRISHIVLKPHGIDLVQKVSEVFSYCPQFQK